MDHHEPPPLYHDSGKQLPPFAHQLIELPNVAYIVTMGNCSTSSTLRFAGELENPEG